MRVLGLIVAPSIPGMGVVDLCNDGKLICLACGAVRVFASPISWQCACRQFSIGWVQLLWNIALIGLPSKDLFYAVNVKSALKLGQVRGVAMLAAVVSGSGRSLNIRLSQLIRGGRLTAGPRSKQVQHMVTRR